MFNLASNQRLSTTVMGLLWPAALVALLSLTRVTESRDPGVPVTLQFTMYCKALTFDRALTTRCGDALVLGVLYQPRYRASYDVMEELREAHALSGIDSIRTLPVKFVAIDAERSEWQKVALDSATDVLIVAPLRGMGMEQISRFAYEHGTLTVSTEPSYVEGGLALGLRLLGGRPKFLINLPVARAQGVDFSAQLLELAEVIQ